MDNFDQFEWLKKIAVDNWVWFSNSKTVFQKQAAFLPFKRSIIALFAIVKSAFDDV